MYLIQILYTDYLGTSLPETRDKFARFSSGDTRMVHDPYKWHKAGKYLFRYVHNSNFVFWLPRH